MDWQRMDLRHFLAALGIALVGGVVGSAIVVGVSGQFVVDLGSLGGALAATILAAVLASRFGLLDNLRQRQRDELTRRYVETVDAVGAVIATEIERALSNWQVVRILIQEAGSERPPDDAVYRGLLARLDYSTGGFGYDMFRVASAYDSVPLFEALATAMGMVRAAQQFYCLTAPAALENIRAWPVEKREKPLKNLSTAADGLNTQVETLRAPVLLTLIRLANTAKTRLHDPAPINHGQFLGDAMLQGAVTDAARDVDALLKSVQSAPISPSTGSGRNNGDPVDA